MRRSILQPEWPYIDRIPVDATCYVCGRPAECRHHVFPGSNRANSEREGCWVYLCHRCHNMSNRSVHMDRELDRQLRQICQAKYERRYGHVRFMSVFGRSWLC